MSLEEIQRIEAARTFLNSGLIDLKLIQMRDEVIDRFAPDDAELVEAIRLYRIHRQLLLQFKSELELLASQL